MFYFSVVELRAVDKRSFFVVLTSLINNFMLKLNLENLVKSSQLKCEIYATQVSPCKLNLCEELFGRIPSSWLVDLYLTAKPKFPLLDCDKDFGSNSDQLNS